MIFLDYTRTIVLKFGEIHTTTKPDWHIFYSQPTTKQNRDQITKVDDERIVSGPAATNITSAVSMLQGPQSDKSQANMGSGANSNVYKLLSIFIANRDTIAHTCFIYTLIGSTETYLVSGVSIPAGGTLTVAEDGAVSVTSTPITSIIAGAALTGGGSSGAVNLDVAVDNASIEVSTDALRVKADGIADTMLRNSNGLSIIGRSANSTGDPADIVAANDHEVLRRSGTSVGFGPVNLAQSAAVTGVLDEPNGGTGQSSISTGDMLYGSASNVLSKLTVGSSGKVIGSSGTIPAWQNRELYACYEDQKSAASNGGASSSTTTHTRTLNQESSDADGIGSLSSNQITLQAGTYRILASAPAYKSDAHKVRWYNATDATYVLEGTSEYNSSGDSIQTRSYVNGTFAIASQKTFELRHYITTGAATFGLGVSVNQGTEIYARVELWKVA